MAVFESLLQMMIDTGVSYIFLWLIFAGVIYALLMKVNLFGDSSANAGIALGASFFTLLGVYAFAPEGLILSFAAGLGFSLVAIFGLIILLSLSGVDVTELGGESGFGGPVSGSAMILVIISFFGALAYNMNWDNLLRDVGNTWQEVVFPILFLIFLLIIINWTTD
ncbi:MAG: hypothetical protein V5A72_00375 [Candidatus Nanohaloarchaea archaeon]